MSLPDNPTVWPCQKYGGGLVSSKCPTGCVEGCEGDTMPDTPTDTEEVEIIKDCWGALNFILAFYEPGQRYLDTEAWKQAEASGRRAHAKARVYLDALPKPPVTP